MRMLQPERRGLYGKEGQLFRGGGVRTLEDTVSLMVLNNHYQMLRAR